MINILSSLTSILSLRIFVTDHIENLHNWQPKQKEVLSPQLQSNSQPQKSSFVFMLKMESFIVFKNTPCPTTFISYHFIYINNRSFRNLNFSDGNNEAKLSSYEERKKWKMSRKKKWNFWFSYIRTTSSCNIDTDGTQMYVLELVFSHLVDRIPVDLMTHFNSELSLWMLNSIPTHNSFKLDRYLDNINAN